MVLPILRNLPAEPLLIGFRDSHVNAAFEGVLAWTWSDLTYGSRQNKWYHELHGCYR